MWVYGTYVPYDDLRAAVAARFICLGSGTVVLLILYGGKYSQMFLMPID